MSTKRMLIDAAHPEETRVAIIDGNKLGELDVESSARKQLKGNIYLAKVTRVEPSLQAAFIDFGGNRHGFLSFTEIHPDYYQIPIADREQLIAEDEAERAEEGAGEEGGEGDNDGVETVGGDEIDEMEARRRGRKLARRYKIQEVIKRRQILLIQVVKEERGNKGAALTTYLSLAGRYCVLMPNTARGGGISRKIVNAKDRKRLKAITSELDVPKGIAVIVRTAGSDRGKAEIKRDYKYLINLWSGIRDLTLESTAPALIHEEGSLINRAIRDLYSREVEEILVEGEEGYRAAKDLMKQLIPSHAKKVQPYHDDKTPLFKRYEVEEQLESMNSHTVHMKSGGYIVINATEALVAIDVNSGRATRGRSIEETALKTNLEAAAEVARQLRLRDLAGLIVIDFIDMEVNRNKTAVERMVKDSMRRDRARSQIGRISPFGLLELSRQRLRPSLTETFSEPCPYCDGSGIRRSTDSTALHVLRGVEEEAAKHPGNALNVAVASQVTLYVLNHKRDVLAEIENKFGCTIVFTEDETLIPPNFVVTRTKTAEGDAKDAPKQRAAQPERSERSERPERVENKETEEAGEGEGGAKRKRRRRSRRRKRSDAPSDEIAAAAETADENGAAEPDAAADAEAAKPEGAATAEAGDGERKPARRRRGRRGGRRRARSRDDGAEPSESTQPSQPAKADDAPAAAASEEVPEPLEAASEEVPEPLEAASEEVAEPLEAASEEAAEPLEAASEEAAEPLEAVSEETPEQLEAVAPARPRRRRRVRKRKPEPVTETAAGDPPEEAARGTEETVAPEPEAMVAEVTGETPLGDAVTPVPADEPQAVMPFPEPAAEPLSADDPEAVPEPETPPAPPGGGGEANPVPEPGEDDEPARKGWWQRLVK